METKEFRFELKEIGDDGSFTGFSAVYGNRDLGGDVFLPGAFTKSINDHGSTFPLMYAHKVNVGVSIVEELPDGILTKGKLNLDKQVARDVHSDMKFYKANGLDFGMSVGYLSISDKTEKKNGTRYMREAMLFENTLTEFPMNTKARVLSIKALMLEHKADFLTALDAAKTWAERGQMLYALDDSLSSIVWDATLTPEQKVAQADESITQFHDAFKSFLPKFLALMDSRYKSAVEAFETKEGRRISAATKRELEAAIASLTALLTEADGTAATSEGAAGKSTEPVDHSALISQIDTLKETFQWN